MGRALLLLVLVLAATPISPAQGLIPIRIAGPPNEGYKDVYYAVQAGIFAKYGLEVQPRITNGGSAVLAGLTGGSYDIAYTNLLPVLQAHVHGLPLQIVAPSTLFSGAHPQNAMLVAADSRLRRARDLDGATIGTQSLQDLNSLAMRVWIDANGGNSSTIRVLEVPSSEAVAALLSRRIAAMSLSEPLLTESLATGKVRVLAKPQAAIGGRFLAQAFLATADFVAQHPDEMARFARAMRESARYNNAHPAQTVQLVSAFSDVPAAVIAHTVRSIDAEYVSPRDIQPLIDAAAKYGLIARPFPAEEIISTAALQQP